MNMGLDQELVDAAIALSKQRWPADAEGGAAAVRAADGRIFTSVALDNVNAGVTLCHETGAIIQAYTADVAVRASVCVFLENAEAAPVILPPCGICRERLALWGPRVEVAVPDGADPRRWRTATLEEVHRSYWGRQFPAESGWQGWDES